MVVPPPIVVSSASPPHTTHIQRSDFQGIKGLTSPHLALLFLSSLKSRTFKYGGQLHIWGKLEIEQECQGKGSKEI